MGMSTAVAGELLKVTVTEASVPPSVAVKLAAPKDTSKPLGISLSARSTVVVVVPPAT